MKTTSLGTIGFIALTLIATAARAQGDPERGPEVALRTGLMLPFGDLAGGNNGASSGPLDNYASKALPFVLEGGYRLDSSLFFGLRFQYAIPDLKGNCTGAASCDGSIVTLGVEGTYRLMPGATFNPWVGAGIGYEWTSVSWSGGLLGNGGGVSVSGIQPLLQVGGDIYVAPKFFLGPFVESAFGRFDSAEVRTGGFTAEGDINDERWHMWLTIGVRGAFDI
jgi:hypothetical protein